MLDYYQRNHSLSTHKQVAISLIWLIIVLFATFPAVASVDVEHYYAYLAYQKTGASEMTPAPIIAKERDGNINIPPGNYYLQLVVIPEGSTEQLNAWQKQRGVTTLWAAYTIQVSFDRDNKDSGIKLHRLTALENKDQQQNYANLFSKQANEITWLQLHKERTKNWFKPIKQVSQGSFYPDMFRTLSMGVDKNNSTSAVYPGNYQGSPTYIYRLHQLDPQDLSAQDWIKRFWDPGKSMGKDTTIDAISSDVTTAIEQNKGFYRAKYFAVPNEKHKQLLNQFETLVVAVAANSVAVAKQVLTNIEKEKAAIARKAQLAKQQLENIRKNKEAALKRKSEEANKQLVEYQRHSRQNDSEEQNQAVQSKLPQLHSKRNTNPSHPIAAETTTNQSKPTSKNNPYLGFALLFIALIVSLALGLVYFFKPVLFERNRNTGNRDKDSSDTLTHAYRSKSSVQNDDRGSGTSGNLAKSRPQPTGGTNPLLQQSASENKASEYRDRTQTKPVSSGQLYGSEYEETLRQQQREEYRTIQREKEEQRKRKIEEQERLFALEARQKDDDRKRQQQQQRQKQPGLKPMEVQPKQVIKPIDSVEQQPSQDIKAGEKQPEKTTQSKKAETLAEKKPDRDQDREKHTVLNKQTDIEISEASNQSIKDDILTEVYTLMEQQQQRIQQLESRPSGLQLEQLRVIVQQTPELTQYWELLLKHASTALTSIEYLINNADIQPQLQSWQQLDNWLQETSKEQCKMLIPERADPYNMDEHQCIGVESGNALPGLVVRCERPGLRNLAEVVIQAKVVVSTC